MGRIFEEVDMGKNVIKSYCNEIHKKYMKNRNKRNCNFNSKLNTLKRHGVVMLWYSLSLSFI